MDAARQATLINKLGSPLADVRAQARAELVGAGEQSIPVLLAALERNERELRTGAALALGELAADPAIEPLARMAAADPDPSAHPLALRALSDIARPDAPARLKLVLIEHLRDKDMFCRALACRGLGRIGDPHCLEALELALRDKESWVRDAARKALTSRQPADAGPGAPHPPGGPGTAVLARDQALDALVVQLKSLDIDRQRQAQHALAARGADAVAAVVPLLWDGLPATRRAAVEALGAIGATAAIDPLFHLLDDEGVASELQAVALYALARILVAGANHQAGPPPGFNTSYVIAFLGDPNPYVRAAAATALINAGGDARRAAVDAILEDDHEWVQIAGLRALARVSSAADGDLLHPLATGLERIHATEARASLLTALAAIVPADGALDPKDALDPEDAGEVASAMAALLDDDDPDLRVAALGLLDRTLGELDHQGVQLLLQLIADDPACAPDALRLVTKHAMPGDARPVPALRAVMDHADIELASAAAAALAKIGGPRAVDALVEVANSKAGAVVAAAAQALTQLDPEGTAVAVRAVDGRWTRELRLRCECGGLLRWIERAGREELRCPACDREYVASSAANKLFAAERTPLGFCRCPECRRKQPLVRRGGGETLVCPVSGEVHIRPYDHPRQVRLLRALPLGACGCCAEPQPLLRVDQRVLCHRTRQEHVPTPRGYALPQQIADDVSAINEALLRGTLGLSQSGLPMVAAGEDDEEQ